MAKKSRKIKHKPYFILETCTYLFVLFIVMHIVQQLFTKTFHSTFGDTLAQELSSMDRNLTALAKTGDLRANDGIQSLIRINQYALTKTYLMIRLYLKMEIHQETMEIDQDTTGSPIEVFIRFLEPYDSCIASSRKQGLLSREPKKHQSPPCPNDKPMLLEISLAYFKINNTLGITQQPGSPTLQPNNLTDLYNFVNKQLTEQYPKQMDELKQEIKKIANMTLLIHDKVHPPGHSILSFSLGIIGATGFPIDAIIPTFVIFFSICSAQLIKPLINKIIDPGESKAISKVISKAAGQDISKAIGNASSNPTGTTVGRNLASFVFPARRPGKQTRKTTAQAQQLRYRGMN